MSEVRLQMKRTRTRTYNSQLDYVRKVNNTCVTSFEKGTIILIHIVILPCVNFDLKFVKTLFLSSSPVDYYRLEKVPKFYFNVVVY